MWSLSSIPTEAAWSVLKRDGGLDSLPPELQESMQSFYEQIPDEQREKIEMIAQAVEQMEPEKKHKIQQMMMITLNHNADKLPEIFNQADPENIFAPQQSEPGTFKLSLVGLGHEFVYGKQSIRKAFPLLFVAAATIFAADGVNQSQGAKGSVIGTGLQEVGHFVSPELVPEPDWGDITSYEDDTAVFQDPIFGSDFLGMGVVENPTWWQRGLAGGLGALQGLSPVGGVGRAGRASTKATGKASRLKEARPMGPAKSKRAQGKLDAKDFKIQQAQSQADAAKIALGKKSTFGGKLGTAAKSGTHRLAQGIAGDPRFSDKVAEIVGAGLTSQGSSPNIHGTASATPSAGGGSTGVGGVGNRASMGQGDKQIWSGALEQKRGGGYGTHKGDNMTIGDQLLKEAKERMNKAVCPSCGKSNCNCKEYKNKADNKKKKPAHGVLVIIGTNAGPGPIKEGKRVKKD